jgi:hypothetical protein
VNTGLGSQSSKTQSNLFAACPDVICTATSHENKTGRGMFAAARLFKSNLNPIATVESLRDRRESDRARHWFLFDSGRRNNSGSSDGSTERGLYENYGLSSRFADALCKTATPEFIVYLASSLQTNVGILAAALNCTPLAAASQVFLQKI